MDEASSVDDDDDSIAGRFGNVDDSERALVRDLLVPLMIFIMMMMATMIAKPERPWSAWLSLVVAGTCICDVLSQSRFLIASIDTRSCVPDCHDA